VIVLIGTSRDGDGSMGGTNIHNSSVVPEERKTRAKGLVEYFEFKAGVSCRPGPPRRPEPTRAPDFALNLARALILFYSLAALGRWLRTDLQTGKHPYSLTLRLAPCMLPCALRVGLQGLKNDDKEQTEPVISLPNTAAQVLQIESCLT